MTFLSIFVQGTIYAALSLPLVYLVSSLVLHKPLSPLANLLALFANVIDKINDVIGRTVAWATLAMVLLQSIIVIQRYVFGVNYIWAQESITYMHGALFMLAAGFTLLHGGHVRVDIFYRDASPRRKALVDFIGVYIFLIPVVATIWALALPYFQISWAIQEGSTETSGIQGVFVLKGIILAFAALMLAQGYALAIRTSFILTGREGGPLEAETQHAII